jgi:hypothetical protein
MPADDSIPVDWRGNPPTVYVEHAGVAPSADGTKLAITVTLTVELDDSAALDAVLRVVGALARRRGRGVDRDGRAS